MDNQFSCSITFFEYIAHLDKVLPYKQVQLADPSGVVHEIRREFKDYGNISKFVITDNETGEDVTKEYNTFLGV